MSFKVELEQHETGGRFSIKGAVRAELTFRRANEKRIVADGTFVDPSLRGSGAAEALFEALVTYAQDNKVLIEPTCSYVAAKLKRRPDLQSLVAS